MARVVIRRQHCGCPCNVLPVDSSTAGGRGSLCSQLHFETSAAAPTAFSCPPAHFNNGDEIVIIPRQHLVGDSGSSGSR